MPAFPELHAPLCGPQASLRFAAERDIPEILIAHQDDPQLYLRLGLARPPSGADLGSRSEGEAVERDLGMGARFTITAPGSDVCRGQVDVHKLDWDNQRAEIGIWVSPGLRGRGMAQCALALASRWLLTAGGLARVEVLTEPDNAAMVAAASAAGFVEEGLLRAYLRERGQRVDVIVMSLITSDITGGDIPGGDTAGGDIPGGDTAGGDIPGERGAPA
jgi:RimJ/RimL family protein N-acetyltransferase